MRRWRHLSHAAKRFLMPLSPSHPKATVEEERFFWAGSDLDVVESSHRSAPDAVATLHVAAIDAGAVAAEEEAEVASCARLRLRSACRLLICSRESLSRRDLSPRRGLKGLLSLLFLEPRTGAPDGNTTCGQRFLRARQDEQARLTADDGA